MKCVISVLGKDRSGIVAAVSVALAECGANIGIAGDNNAAGSQISNHLQPEFAAGTATGGNHLMWCAAGLLQGAITIGQ